jgi:hypothetical protein
MKLELIPNEMFDNGSFEYFNFWVCDQDSTYQVSASSDIIKHMRSSIQVEMDKGGYHINTSKMGLVYAGVHILEIQWG